MQFQFEKTYHDFAFDEGATKRVSLVNNRVMGESYRYVLNIRWGNIVYHFSVFEVMPYAECIDKESKRMWRTSNLHTKPTTGKAAVKFNLAVGDIEAVKTVAMAKMQRTYEKGLNL